MAVGANARNFILMSDEGRAVHRRFLNGSTALSAGDMVTLSSNVLAEVTGANTVGAMGVCAEDIGASEYGTIYCSGIFKGDSQTGINFSLGDRVYNYDKDELSTGASSDVPVGRVVPFNDTDPSSGGDVYFELWSIVLGDYTAKS